MANIFGAVGLWFGWLMAVALRCRMPRGLSYITHMDMDMDMGPDMLIAGYRRGVHGELGGAPRGAVVGCWNVD